MDPVFGRNRKMGRVAAPVTDRRNMESSRLINLPIELHTSILKFVLAITGRSIDSNFPIQECWEIGRSLYYHSDLPAYDRRMPWMEKKLHENLIFPFNVADVCQLWRDILVGIPEYWHRVVFDVAKDPTRFLDAFSWSKNREGIEIFIFNSTSIVQDVDRALESARVFAITEALKPHIQRCKFIIYHLTYSSSLPPPNIFLSQEMPLLEDLTLDSRVDDIGLVDAPSYTMELYNSFPMLKTLWLTGFWFFFLARLSDPVWLMEFRGAESMLLQLTRFTFPKHGSYCLPQFMSYLEMMEDAFTYIYLSDLSLEYPHDYSDESDPRPEDVFFLSSDMHFNHVSKDFIAQLIAITDLEVTESLSFTNCEVPYFKRNPGGDLLTLEGIIDDDNSNSLRNIVKIWGGHEITFRSCPSLNDKFLLWLASETKLPADGRVLQHPCFPAHLLTFLTISNCPSFSQKSLQQLVEVRKVVRYDEGLRSVIVDGRCMRTEEENTSVYR
ncbi:hypothetical protein GALMADRAFT_238683 [Galerina marginata CBS 339.88]|uniref:F-box domain-containing protein n=1 Tax=Galerina marginata (strain CBS 339.88) TaxID=685588 RepID=A0A067TVH4_GALM3|nr:hypothetical protein GALMADRAFT_238683 [Galerina marginata CBS 339.88]